MKRKVCVVITSRASYSRFKSAMFAIKEHPELELQIVIAASAILDRYGNAIQFIENDSFEINARVFMLLEGENLVTMAKSTGLGLLEIPTVLDNLQPDVVITIADRFETMATAISASYMNIPLVHIQGGEVTGSIDEKVRHAITKLSNYHFVATAKAQERVVKMGEDPKNVFVTGCPSIDLATCVINQTSKLNLQIFEKYGGVGDTFDMSIGFLVVLQHPVTTEHARAKLDIKETLHAVKNLDMPTFWFWPNPDAGSDGTSKGIRSFRELETPHNMHFFKHIDSLDFLKLVYNSKCIIGNSSVAIRECSNLGVPAVDIGSRQEGREKGINVISVEHNREKILDAIRKQLKNGRYKSDSLYGDGKAGKRIAKLLNEISLDKIEKKLTY